MNKIIKDEFMTKKIHYKVLKDIADNPGCYQSQMKCCTYSHLVTLVKRYVELGWVYIKMDNTKGNKRTKNLYITSKGLKVLSMIEGIEELKK